MMQPKVVVIGAGVGGLVAAAALAKAGVDVTVLEAHVYPGGCAGTFFHKGYRFDAGATLAGGFYPGGPMDLVARATGIDDWHAHPAEPAMTVHLSDGSQVTRWGDERRWTEYQQHFGAAGERFFRWQEQRADALWDLALRVPPWPSQNPGELATLLQSGLGWIGKAPLARLHPGLLADGFRPVAAHLHNAPARLKQFVDAQLLIAAQATSEQTYALYGASALDLPRRGVVHLEGGIGSIARTVAETIAKQGGTLRYRQEVKTVRQVADQSQRRWRVTTKRGETMEADLLIANLPPWNIARLLGDAAPSRLRSLPNAPQDGWGAVMVYAGVDSRLIPDDLPLHQQIVAGEPMGEGNTVFLSFSPEWDQGRAPAGQRVLTMSTHTQLAPWWQLRNSDEAGYEARKQVYLEKMLGVARQAFPWLHEAIRFSMVGTPITFERFTRRHMGWVGGFPQTNLFRAWAPKLQPGLWMVGDSIFPGQSTAAVALGGLRVASGVLRELNYVNP